MKVHYSPPPAVRKALWEKDDPGELRCVADEWESLGFTDYAERLRACADGRLIHAGPAPW